MNYRAIFLVVLILTFAFRLLLLHFTVWPVNGDEAQYWNWSRHLAWGYYSKPPMIAWVVAITTGLFGKGAMGLRFGSMLSYLITSCILYRIGCRWFTERMGFWSGITFLFIPGVCFSSNMISTDPLLLLFWTLALWGLIEAIEGNSLCWWLFTAVALGLSFYAKYAAMLFDISLLLTALCSNYRFLWKKMGFYLALIIPFFMLIPNLIWNANHHFASVGAVTANAALSGDLFHPMNFVNFVVSQFGVFGPILFTALLVILIRTGQLFKDRRFQLLFIFTFVTLGIMTLESFLSRAHANWAAPAYIAGTLLVCAVIIERKKIIWLWSALILHLIVMLGLANAQTIIQTLGITMDQEMTITGWPQAAIQIQQLQKTHPDTLILVDDRMLLTQILYYADANLKNTVRWNPTGEITDQYDIVTTMQGKEGQNFILASYQENPYLIESRFAGSRLLAHIDLMTIDGHTKPLYLYYLSDFRGYRGG